MTERQIDEILAASFPASDPPSWTLGVETVPGPEAHGRKNKIEGNPSGRKPREE